MSFVVCFRLARCHSFLCNALHSTLLLFFFRMHNSPIRFFLTNVQTFPCYSFQCGSTPSENRRKEKNNANKWLERREKKNERISSSDSKQAIILIFPSSNFLEIYRLSLFLFFLSFFFSFFLWPLCYSCMCVAHYWLNSNNTTKNG